MVQRGSRWTPRLNSDQQPVAGPGTATGLQVDHGPAPAASSRHEDGHQSVAGGAAVAANPVFVVGVAAAHAGLGTAAVTAEFDAVRRVAAGVAVAGTVAPQAFESIRPTDASIRVAAESFGPRSAAVIEDVIPPAVVQLGTLDVDDKTGLSTLERMTRTASKHHTLEGPYYAVLLPVSHDDQNSVQLHQTDATNG